MATKTAGHPETRRFRPAILYVIAIALVVIVGILATTGALAKARQLIPGLRQPSPTFQTTTVSRGNVVVSVTATGPVAAVNTTPLTFKTSGQLDQLKVAVGQHVTKGQVLAVLDTSDLQTAFNQAQANLQGAQANLAKVQAGATQQQVAVAQVSVENAKVSAANAVANVPTSQTTAANSIKAAQNTLHTAQLGQSSAQDSLSAAIDQETRGLAADQTAIINAQKNLASVKSTAAGDVPIQESNLEKAKDALWSAQTSRDQTCSQSSAISCQAADANVGGAQTSLNAASLQMQQSLKQDQQSVQQAQTSLDQANSTLANDKAKFDAAVVSAQNQVKQAQAAVTSANTGVGQAQAQATATVQSAQSQADQAKGSVSSAQANYNQTVAPPAASDIAQAKAQVVNAQAAFDSAKTNLDSATLTAPFAAEIAAINGSVGQYVNGGPVPVGANALFTLIDLSSLQVTTQVNEADIGKVNLGDTVSFTVNAYPNTVFSGKVLTIQPVGTIVQNVVDYNVTCSISATKDASLYPGMTATATIISQQHDGVLTVPNTALSFAQTAARSGLVTRSTAGARPNGTPQSGNPNGRGANGNGFAGRTGNGAANRGQAANGGQTGAGASNVNRGLLLTLTNGNLTPLPVTLGITDGSVTEILTGAKQGEPIVIGESGATSAGPANGNGRPAVGGPFGGRFGG